MDQIVIVPLKGCPWCKQIPDLSLCIDDRRYTKGTWMWKIECNNYKCKIRPSSHHVSVRKTSKKNPQAIINKLDTLSNWWNRGLAMAITHGKRVDISEIINAVQVEEENDVCYF